MLALKASTFSSSKQQASSKQVLLVLYVIYVTSKISAVSVVTIASSNLVFESKVCFSKVMQDHRKCQ